LTGPWAYLLLCGAGLVAGTLNVIAGGGSFLTLPLLIFLGLPPTVANGTNRVGIFLQNVAAVWGFSRHGVVDWRSVLWAAVPATLGAGVGTWAALRVGEDAFREVLAYLMIAVTLFTLWNPLGLRRPGGGEPRPPNLPALVLGFFVVGIYGGFVQAGVGFLLLAATTLAGLDLVRGNAVKVLSVLVYTGLSLAMFAAGGRVVWGHGLALAAGTVLGSQVGVRLTVLKGHAWVRGVVTVAVLGLAVKLLLMG
jgi:uncharacterized membrane protein YfcA